VATGEESVTAPSQYQERMGAFLSRYTRRTIIFAGT
jgi:hypothetical protein